MGEEDSDIQIETFRSGLHGGYQARVERRTDEGFKLLYKTRRYEGKASKSCARADAEEWWRKNTAKGERANG